MPVTASELAASRASLYRFGPDEDLEEDDDDDGPCERGSTHTSKPRRMAELCRRSDANQNLWNGKPLTQNEQRELSVRTHYAKRNRIT
jgi:hypothetical protein